MYSKAGSVLLGPENTNTLWSGFGGGCQTNNDGDATVVFDTLSQRWVIQQFSVSTTPYLECIAVSSTSDATGSWYRYSFQLSNFPDYPKLSVWSDAYYASFNLFRGNRYLGAELCAYDRAAMLTGAAASAQCFAPSSAKTSLLPATIDGPTAPPAGEREWYLGISPTTANALTYYTFHVDWNNSANSSVSGPTTVAVDAFSEPCNGGGTCIPQPGTSNQLDSLGDRLMWRLAYRDFGDHEAMVVSHAVTAGSSVGMRWYELRPSNGSVSVYQQGTYAPDSAYRWMGSIAMDKFGNMALGDSVSSSSIYPEIDYTGRVASDPLGTMSQGETKLYPGSGSQTGGLTRWGDYSEMSVDPTDDCTFWYVNEYLPNNGSFNWATRIGSFSLPGCKPPTVTTGSASNVGTTSAIVAGTVNPNGEATTYHFDYGATTSYGSQAPAAPDPSAGSGSTSQSVSAVLTGLTGSTTYHYRLEATNAAGTTYGPDERFTTSPTYANAVLGEPSLIHYWRLGEESGSTAVDSKGSADGKYEGGVTLGQPGALAGDPNTAVGFDGSTGYVSLPSLGSASDFTIEGWSDLNSGASSSPNGNNTLYGGWGSVRLIIRPSGVYAGAWIGGTEYVVSVSTKSNVGSWVYWAMVRSGSTLTVYRNGTSVGSISTLSTGTVDLAGAIGRQDVYNNNYLHGTIDEVAVYNSALPSSTIQQHYALASPYANAVLGEPSLIHYWRLGEESGSTAVDSKGSADGKYEGGVTLGQPGALAGDPNTAVGFDGSTGYVSLPSLGSASDFTVEGWTNLNSGASSSPNGNNTLYGSWGNVRLIIRPSGVYAGAWIGGTEYVVQVGTNSNIGSWVYWAMVRSGSSLAVYRDGILVGSTSTLPSGIVNLAGAIGAQNPYGNNFLHGTIDEIAVYNGALPGSTIQQHYETGLNG